MCVKHGVGPGVENLVDLLRPKIQVFMNYNELADPFALTDL